MAISYVISDPKTRIVYSSHSSSMNSVINPTFLSSLCCNSNFKYKALWKAILYLEREKEQKYITQITDIQLAFYILIFFFSFNKNLSKAFIKKI